MRSVWMEWALLFVAGCASAHGERVDFAPLRPGICDETPERCEDGHAWVEVERDLEPRTLVYVLDEIGIPLADEAGRVAGFDLDDVISPGSDAPDASCVDSHADYVSSVDPGVVGVDNLFHELIPAIEGLLDASQCPGTTVAGCLPTLFAREIAEGRLLLLLEVSGVESATMDDAVSVTVWRGALPDGALPLLGEDGRLAPGQSFAAEPVGEPAAGTILDGRLAFSPPRVSLSLAAGVISLRIEMTHMRFDIGEDALTRGVVGGPHREPLPVGVGCEFVRPAFDLPGSTPGCCDVASAGLVFTATRAEIAR